MNQSLRLSNGSIFNSSYVIKNGNTLWIYMYDQNVSFQDFFLTLNDPNATCTITQINNGSEVDYTGFTELFVVRKEDDNYMTAGLRKS